jgi:hypothetical protein
MTVTREDLVRQLNNYSASAASNRVAYWTDIGLLQPLDGQWPGTGHHRHYPETALADVRLLSLMAQLGVALPLQKAALRLTPQCRAELRHTLRAALRLLA